MRVTTVIPTIAGREALLAQAVRSVRASVVQPEAVIVQVDTARRGATATRNAALREVSTEWVAFLDDDDYWYPQHLGRLLDAAVGADLVYPWFDIECEGRIDNRRDPLAAPYGGRLLSPIGRPFGSEQREYLLRVANFVPITVLARTEAIRTVGGFPQPGTTEWPNVACEDWGLWQRLLRAGASFRHVPERTWVWRHHDHNTAGRGAR